MTMPGRRWNDYSKHPASRTANAGCSRASQGPAPNRMLPSRGAVYEPAHSANARFATLHL